MKKSDLITIIIPTYNRAWSLPRAIDSVLKQSSNNWRLIIVDDGSIDDTKEVISPYLKDSRIQYFYKKNGGVGAARNFGVNKVKTKYVTFLDSDDELVFEAISKMTQDILLFNKYKVKLILYFAKKTDNNTYVENRFKDLEILCFNDIVKGKWPVVETIQLMDISVFNKVKFPELFGGLESILWHEVLKDVSDALIRTIQLIIYHTEHDSRLTGRDFIVRRSMSMPELYENFLEKFEADYMRHNRKKLAYFYIEKGLFEIIRGGSNGGRKSLLQAFDINKTRFVVIMIIYVLSFLPKKIFVFISTCGHSLKSIIK